MLFKMSSAICFILDQSKILSSGNGLSPYARFLSAPEELAFCKSMEEGEKAGMFFIQA